MTANVREISWHSSEEDHITCAKVTDAQSAFREDCVLSHEHILDGSCPSADNAGVRPPCLAPPGRRRIHRMVQAPQRSSSSFQTSCNGPKTSASAFDGCHATSCNISKSGMHTVIEVSQSRQWKLQNHQPPSDLDVLPMETGRIDLNLDVPSTGADDQRHVAHRSATKGNARKLATLHAPTPRGQESAGGRPNEGCTSGCSSPQAFLPPIGTFFHTGWASSPCSSNAQAVEAPANTLPGRRAAAHTGSAASPRRPVRKQSSGPPAYELLQRISSTKWAGSEAGQSETSCFQNWEAQAEELVAHITDETSLTRPSMDECRDTSSNFSSFAYSIGGNMHLVGGSDAASTPRVSIDMPEQAIGLTEPWCLKQQDPLVPILSDDAMLKKPAVPRRPPSHGAMSYLARCRLHTAGGRSFFMDRLEGSMGDDGVEQPCKQQAHKFNRLRRLIENGSLLDNDSKSGEGRDVGGQVSVPAG